MGGRKARVLSNRGEGTERGAVGEGRSGDCHEERPLGMMMRRKGLR